MAKNQRSNNPPQSQWNNNLQFCQHNWSKEDDAAFTTWLQNEAPTVEEVFEVLPLSGYKISVAYDDDSRCYKSSIICSAPKHPHNGFCFSSWDEDAIGAIFVSVFKLNVLYLGVRPPTSRGERGSRG